MRAFNIEETNDPDEQAFLAEILREPVRAAELISNDVAARLHEENPVLAVVRAARFAQPYAKGGVVWVGLDEGDRFGVRADGTGYAIVGGDGSEVLRTVSTVEEMVEELRSLLSSCRLNVDF